MRSKRINKHATCPSNGELSICERLQQTQNPIRDQGMERTDDGNPEMLHWHMHKTNFYLSRGGIGQLPEIVDVIVISHQDT